MKIVHVGLMKSGTTFIQHAFAASRSAFSENGILYPGQLFNQQHACYGLCGHYIPWVTPRRKWSALGESMLKEIDAHAGDILISSEALSSMDAEGIARFCEVLGGVDCIVITVRNFAKTLLSAWQQNIKGGGKNSLTDFLYRIEKDRKHKTGVWNTYSFGSIAKKWRQHANVELIVVGKGAPSVDDPLLEAFAQIIGSPLFNPGELSESARNVSLCFEDVEVLRYINRLFEAAPRGYREQITNSLLRSQFFPAASYSSGKKIALPSRYAEKIERWAESEIAKLPSDIQVHGSLNDLIQSKDVPQMDMPNFNPEECFMRFVRVVANKGK